MRGISGVQIYINTSGNKLSLDYSEIFSSIIPAGRVGWYFNLKEDDQKKLNLGALDTRIGELPENSEYSWLFTEGVHAKSDNKFSLLLEKDLCAEALAKYIWNMQLSEAYYPLLHGVEIALRSRVHTTLRKHTNRLRWMDESLGLLQYHQVGMVKQIEKRLRREGKSRDVNTIVCSLSFGFWTSLFGPKYDKQLWHKGLLNSVFPYADNSVLGIHRIRARLNRMRHLRNKVFHHEPIWHWPNLAELHKETLVTASWLSKDWSRALTLLDRFPSIHSAGYKPIQNQVNALRG